MRDLKRENSLNPVLLITSFIHEIYEDMPSMHKILHVYNEPLMIIIALMLALVEKPTTTWTWLNMLLMLMNVTSDPMEKEIRKQVQNQKLVREFCNLLQETNQTGNVKSVSRIHAGNGLIMTIAWSGKGKGSHTMWLFKNLYFIHMEIYPSL